MIHWLNSNSPAVQAASALMSTVLTCFIAVLTFRYVALTGTLAEAAKKQVEIAQLQANTAKDLKAATLQQQQLEQQRSADARARDQSTAEVARRQLSGLAARYLALFAGFSSITPSESVFRLSPPITEGDITAMRDAARIGGTKKFDELEGVLSALTFMADLQKRVKETNPGLGYAFSSGETAMYTSNLRNLRSGLEQFTEFRPTSTQ